MNSTNNSNGLFNSLPASILSTIFVLAQTSQLSLLNKNMYYTSQQLNTISNYMLQYVLYNTVGNVEWRLRGIFESYTRINVNEAIGILVLKKIKSLDYEVALEFALRYKWRNILNRLLKMHVVIDRDTSMIIHKGTQFVNEGECLDIDVSNLFTEFNESQGELRAIKMSESLYIIPLVATETSLVLLEKAVCNIKEGLDIKLFVDVCNTIVELSSEIFSSFEKEIHLLDSKFMTTFVVYCAYKSCESNHIELLKIILNLKMNTNFLFHELEILSHEFGMEITETLIRFIRDSGNETKMGLLVYIACSYYSVYWDSKGLVKFLEENYTSSKHVQILFDAAIHHRNEKLVKEYIFRVEPSSENKRKITEMAYRTNSVDLIRLLLNNSDKLKGDLDENALKTAIKNNDYKLAKDIINKYPNTASIYCLEEAVRAGDVRTSRLLIEAGVDLFSPEFEGINISIESRDLDMLKLLLENGASVELIDQCATEKLCSIKNHEIAERLLELFGKNEGKLQAYDKTTIGMKPRFDKTMLCLIKVCQSHDQYNPDNNVEFNEFNEHLDLYEKVMVVVNSKRKDISDVFHSYYTSFCFSSLKSKISGACYDKLVDIVEYIVENGLQTTFSDTEHKEAGGFSYGEGLGMLNNRHYEMVKLELVDRNFEMLKLLVEYGMNVNSHDSLILRTAYKGGDINWINYFISKGIRLEGGSDGFDEAIRSNNIEVLEHWVRNGGVIPKNPEYECINMACLLGNFDMVKLLVESGVDLSDPERNGVRIACRLGLRRTLKYLLDNNAVVDGVPHYQLEHACIIEDVKLIKIILDYYDDLGVLKKRDCTNTKTRKTESQNDSCFDNKKADGFEEYKITKALLERSEPIQNSDLIDGIKAAVAIANIEILRLLLTYKFNLSDSSKILKIAVQAGNTEVIKLLFENGWNVNDEINALDVALEANNVEMIELLLKCGAKIKSNSSFLRSINLEDIETLKLILNSCPEIGGAPILLYIAIEKDNLEAVKLLLKDTATLEDSEFDFVFQACKINNLEILKILFAKGAKIEKGYFSGETQTCRDNNLILLKLLLEKDSNLVLKCISNQ